MFLNFLTRLLSIIFIMFLSHVGNQHTNKINTHYLQLEIKYFNKLLSLKNSQLLEHFAIDSVGKIILKSLQSTAYLHFKRQ